MGWMLTVLFAVLVAAYALFLFVIVFIADLSDVDSLRGTAAFLLILAVAAFGALLFVGSGTMTDVDDEEEEDLLESPGEPDLPPEPAAAAVADVPGACPNCAKVNPEGANFCNSCGTRLSPDS